MSRSTTQSSGHDAASRATAASKRAGVAVVLVVLGSLLVGLAVPVLWAERTLLDTDAWVATVAPLASEPVVQQAAAESLSGSVLHALDRVNIAERFLPPALQERLAPLGDAVETFVDQQADEFVRSPAFAAAWAEGNRAWHSAVMAGIEGRDGPVLSARHGVVAVQLRPLGEGLRERLRGAGVPNIDLLPAIGEERRIVLLESETLGRLMASVSAWRSAAGWLPLLAAATLAAAVVAARDRLRAVLHAGVGVLAVMLAQVATLALGRAPATRGAAALGETHSAAAGLVYDTVFAGLSTAVQSVALAAALVTAIALVALHSRPRSARNPDAP